jgi:hypothetical protein
VCLFDWDGWRPNVGTEDLPVWLPCIGIPTGGNMPRRPCSMPFHDELLMRGVKGYDRRALRD